MLVDAGADPCRGQRMCCSFDVCSLTSETLDRMHFGSMAAFMTVTLSAAQRQLHC